MTVLVTGGQGFIARALIERLRADGVPVRTTHRPGAIPPSAGWGDSRPFDLRDPVPDDLLSDVHTVVHLAGRGDRRSTSDEEMFEVNAWGTERLVGAAVEAGVEHFILGSSVFVHGDAADHEIGTGSPLRPLDGYATSKLQAERAVAAQRARLRVTIVRLPLVLGDAVARRRLSRRLLSVTALPVPSPPNRRSFIDRADLVDAIARLISEPHEVSRVVIPAPTGTIGFEAVLRAASEGTGRRPRLIRVPRALFRGPHAFVRLLTGHSIAGVHADLIVRAGSRALPSDDSLEAMFVVSPPSGRVTRLTRRLIARIRRTRD